jgi:large subunit ribosomal protein L10
MLTKQQKREQSDQLRTMLADAKTLFLMENAGLNVNEINELRAQVRKTESTYKVYKNTVVKLAIEGTELEGLIPDLVGPKALAFTSGDGVELAKVLRGFAKDHPELTFQRAYLDGQILEADAAQKLADLPSREELIAKLLHLLYSPIRRLATALNGPTQGLAAVLGQIANKRESEGGS